MADFSIVPALALALLEISDTLDVEIGIGNPPGLSSRDYLGILATDPDATRPTSGATGETDWATSMTPDGFNDNGTMALCAWASGGSDDMLDVVQRVFAIRSAVGQFVVDNYDNVAILGVVGLWECHLGTYELQTFPSEDGAVAYLLFSLAYQATTP